MDGFGDKFFYPSYLKSGYKKPIPSFLSFEPTDKYYIRCPMCNLIWCNCDDSSDGEQYSDSEYNNNQIIDYLDNPNYRDDQYYDDYDDYDASPIYSDDNDDSSFG